MQAHPRSVFHLFDGKRRYVVPLFQRQYVWNREDQWERLWEDITRAYDRRAEQGKTRPHFMGAVVLEQVRTFGNQIQAHLIIDGQQRLTTFQILLSAFRDVAKTQGREEYATEIERYLLNTGIMEKPDEEKFKLWPTRTDQPQFVWVVGGEALDDLRNRKQTHHGQIAAGYMYFFEAIQTFVKQRSESEKTGSALERLFQVVRDDLELVSIELEDEDDPQVIFETLNAHGEPLLASDLLRNFLFWRASRNEEDRDRLYEELWLPLEDPFWKKEERVGRLKRPRIDVFLQYFLEARTASEINVGRLFHEYKGWIVAEKPFKNVEAELTTLRAYADNYQRIIFADDEQPYGPHVKRLRQLDVGTMTPLLLQIFADEQLDDAEKASIVIDLESYIVRRMVCGLTPKNYNNVFLQVVKEIHKKSLRHDVVRRALSSFQGDASLWPDDRQFQEAWLTRRVYREIKPAFRIELILSAIEAALRSAKSESIVIKSSLTIEHVLPQQWYETWPLADGSIAQDSMTRFLNNVQSPEADLRDSLVDTFGNLTLLTQQLNSSISNGPFELKRPEICKQSALALNRYFQDVAEWSPTSIQARGKQLFDIAASVWPAPQR